MKQETRHWATPLATGLFLVIALTGILLFFHIEGGLIKPAHKWLSWLFVVGVALHTLANWKAFTAHFTRKSGILIIGSSALVALLAVMPFFGNDGGGKLDKKTARAAMMLLEKMPLREVAAMMGASVASLQERLAAAGIEKAEPSCSLEEISIMNGREGSSALGIILKDGRMDGGKPYEEK